MGRKRFSPEQIIVKLREAEVIESKGLTQVEAAKKAGYSRTDIDPLAEGIWWITFGTGKAVKELEKENIRLKRLVADLSLDNAILKDTSLGNL